MLAGLVPRYRNGAMRRFFLRDQLFQAANSVHQWLKSEDGDFGVVINFKTARTYFQDAAEGGDHDAQRQLGSAYMDGTLGLKTDL